MATTGSYLNHELFLTDAPTTKQLARAAEMTTLDTHVVAQRGCEFLTAVTGTSPLSATLPMIICLHDYSIHAITMLLLVLLVSLHCRRRLGRRHPCHSAFELRSRGSLSAECTAPTNASKHCSRRSFSSSSRRRRRHAPHRACHPP
jgi:hypothetical protein